MIKILIILTVAWLGLTFWCCLKTASDVYNDDDDMEVGS